MSEVKFGFNPTVPTDPNVTSYFKMMSLIPDTYTNWREETLSWKDSVYLGANLSAEMTALRLKGPDAVRLLNENTVGNFTNMKIGTGRHHIFCSEKGNIVADGITLRTAEDEFYCYAAVPMLPLLANSGKYDVEPIHQQPNDFMFQIAGPRSLEVVENAAEEDLHDIKFMHFRSAVIAGRTVRIFRVGMGGTLSYEVHGKIEDSHAVYNKLYEVGLAYGIKKLGYRAYVCNHGENGYPQAALHFPFAWKEVPEVVEIFGGLASETENAGQRPIMSPMNIQPNGSLSDDISDYFRNPFELGWGNAVKFDHEFTGRAALEKIAKDPNTYVPVSLIWDVEDMKDIVASFMEKDAEPYKEFVFPQDLSYNFCGSEQDKVLNEDGELVGKASCPVYTLYYRKMFSFACVHPKYAVPGTVLTLVWGNPEHRKKLVKVTVEKFPMLDLVNNRDFDVETIPHYHTESQ